MTTINASGQTNPSWWSQSAGPSGEADAAESGTGGTNNDFGFSDLIDVINPLQHIPIVSTLYRELTGDQMSETARMAGGTIWGGPLGLIGALANTITERETGKDIGGTALAMARGQPSGDPDGAPDPGLAQAVAEAPAGTMGDPTGAPLPPLSEAVARFAAATPASPPIATTGATPTFSGSAADRLDAFIRQSTAIRSPGPSAVATASRPDTTPIPLQAAVAQVPSGSRMAAEIREKPDPLKLASDGNTDVAKWMSRALDRYETLKDREQS